MTRAAGRSLLGISTPLATTYDVALLDLDGVVYVGPDPIPSAAPALAKARAAGMRLAFVTNNASRDPAAVAAHLVALGVPADGRRGRHVVAGGCHSARRTARCRRVGARDRERGAAQRRRRRRTARCRVGR